MAFFFCVVNVNASVAATAYYILLLLLSDGGNDDKFGDPLHDDVYDGGGFGTEKKPTRPGCMA